MKTGTRKGSWQNAAMIFLILVSLALLGVISYETIQDGISYFAVSNISSVLITVTGILLGLSSLAPGTKSLERIKLQITLTIVTILWFALLIVVAQTNASILSLSGASELLRYSLLAGIGLFMILVAMYSTGIIEATRQRLMVEQAARESQKGTVS